MRGKVAAIWPTMHLRAMFDKASPDRSTNRSQSNAPAHLQKSKRDLPVVLVTNSLSQKILEPLEAIAHVVQGPANGDLMPRKEVVRLAPQLAGIINQAELRVDRSLLDRAPQLRIVANVSAGVDNLDLNLMTRHGVYATNAPDAFTEATADFAIALLLALARRLVAADRHVRSNKWHGFQPGVWDGTLLHGKILGLIGYGTIGKAVARRARAFGMEVWHHRRSPSAMPGRVSLERLLRESDFVSVHVPITPETHHLLNRDRLSWMKSTAFLVNTSRGAVVDETALITALQSGRLAGAALDVFEQEPLVPKELLAMENVVLTPHVAGGAAEARDRARRLCVENVIRILTKKPPLTPVNAPVFLDSFQTGTKPQQSPRST